MSSSSPAVAPHVVEDCLGVVQLLSDGTVTRPSVSLLTANDPPPARDLLPDVQWKDVVYDEAHDLRLRIYKPNTTTGGENEKLPVLVYFHGGGFCIASYAHPSFHAVALRLAHDLPALVLSADYRLAPEHRLPAAHHDAETLLSWLRRQATTTSGSSNHPCWLSSSSSADFERVFVCGDSAGGNIAHQVAVRYGSPGAPDLAPIRIAGCVLLWPYFGGEDRTASEAAAPTDAVMSLALFDQMWRLALPAGATRDHPAANPFGPDSAPLDAVEFPPVLVVDPEEDLLGDRIRDYVARLKDMGKPVELVEFAGQGHAFFIYEPWGAAADELLRVLRRFVHGMRGGATTFTG